MIEPCISCEKTTCRACVHWTAFECELCTCEDCQECLSFRYGLWALEGLLKKPELEAVIWPCK